MLLDGMGRSPFTRPGSRASMSKVMEPLTADSDISYVSSGRRSMDRGFQGAWNSSTCTDSYRLSNVSEFEVSSPSPASPMLEMGGGTNKSSIDNTINDDDNNNNNNSNVSSYPQDMSFCSLQSETFSWPSNSHAQVFFLSDFLLLRFQFLNL